MSSDQFALRAQGIGKQYDLSAHTSSATTMAEAVVDRVRGRTRRDPQMLWALDDVSFDIEAGSAYGIIGRNGAGKSTLLKILSRITRPTRGEVEVRGRVGSLLEVGTGFHPELTGRENIFLNGAILGMRRREIVRQFDAIVAFAETEAFLDVPVKRYSSGMYVRLAFAVAAHLEPDILIVDEVLAVGDAAFQKKCLGKMGDVTRQDGRTVLLVSHNLVAVTGLCSRAMLLDQGRLVSEGPVHTVAADYMRSLEQHGANDLATRTDRSGTGKLKLTSVRVSGPTLHAPVQSGEDAVISIGYETADGKPARNVCFSCGIRGAFDERLFHLSTAFAGEDFPVVPATGVVHCRIARLPLQPGSYRLALFTMTAQEVTDYVPHAGGLDVEAGDFFGSGRLPPLDEGQLLVGHDWKVDAAE
jgi:lipopolysaccharide transport system ATP-binding protein